MPSTVHNIASWISHAARSRGAALAVADAQRRLDYAGFEARIARAAAWLTGSGVEPGARVAFALGNRSAALELVMAAARIGAISLPINTRLAPPEVAFLLDDAQPRVLVHEAALAEFARTACRLASSSPIRLAAGGAEDEYEAALAAAGTGPHDVLPVEPDAAVILMYTSGTTGRPKGALLSHRKTLFNALNARVYFGIRPDDRVLVAPPLFHSLGLKILSLPALHAGAAVHLRAHFDAGEVWRSVAAERITYLGGVPTHWARLLEALDDPAHGAHDRSSLRFGFTAGAAIPVEIVEAFAARGLQLQQGYGQTETSILCCLDGADALRKAGSVGRPVRHLALRVCDVESLAAEPPAWRDCAPGEAGEIVARGPIAMLGYWQRPAETARTLREGWVRTGDLARMDDEGFVTLVGRARELYISGGENVYPAEVEAALCEHPAIVEAAVVGVPDERWGEAGRAYIVLAAEAELDAPALRAWARERLAAFKVPRELVAVRELPRTASGKVQKHRLAALEASRLA